MGGEKGADPHCAYYLHSRDLRAILISEAALKRYTPEALQIIFAHEQGHDWDRSQRPRAYSAFTYRLQKIEQAAEFFGIILSVNSSIFLLSGKVGEIIMSTLLTCLLMAPGTIDRELIRKERRADCFAYEETDDAQALADIRYDLSFVSKVKSTPLRAIASGVELFLCSFTSQSAPSWEARYWRRQAQKDARQAEALGEAASSPSPASGRGKL